MKRDRTIVQYGPNVLMERHAQPLWSVYVRERVVGGKHPVHGRATTERHVWVRKGIGVEASARRACLALQRKTKPAPSRARRRRATRSKGKR